MKKVLLFAAASLRTAGFALTQGLLALVFFLGGTPDPWGQSVKWWPLTALGTNLLTLAFLEQYFRTRGTTLVRMVNFQRETWKKDLPPALGILVLSLPLAVLPAPLLSLWLFGDPEAGSRMMFLPLPYWSVGLAFLLPLTQAAVELPFYFRFLPFTRVFNSGTPAGSWLIPSFFLSFQHAAFPLLPDPFFMLWRVGMFLPFSLLAGLGLSRFPGALPYLMAVHVLLDLSLPLLLLKAAS